MTTFLALVVIIIVIGFFARNNQSENNLNYQQKNIKKPKISKADEKTLYKKKGIKTFDIKGMYYRNLNPKIHSGEFVGFAQTENNSHDMYAVGIYNKKNELLGYTPKGNKRLNTSLIEWHNGRIIVWGRLSHDDYDDRWYGTVYIPIGYNESQLMKIEKVLNLIIENQTQIKNKEKSTEKYFEILRKHDEITELLNELQNPDDIYYSFPSNLIPSISKHLEKEKNWEKLLELEKYQDLIFELSERFKNSTLNRIKKAKENVA